MDWSDVLADPSLSDLPYKVETNEHGQIVMSPASNEHGYYQVEIAAELRARASGRTITESSVGTAKGVKVADVAWCSDTFVAAHHGENPFAAAPEVCVEVVSPGNSSEEIAEKRALYLAAGAREVWECDLTGRIRFFNATGEVTASDLFPGFPNPVG